jgi:hypothetical protein
VYTRVHSQSTALNELFAAAGMIAYVRSDTAVDAFCSSVSLLTHPKSEARCCLTVSREITTSGETF